MVWLSRRSALVGLTALGATAAMGGTAQAGASRGPHVPPLDIVTGEDGFSAPQSAAAGAVSFRLRTTSHLTGAVGLVRLRRGVSVAAFRTRLRRIFATEGRENIEATKALMASAELYGGGFTHVGTDTVFTLDLEAGRYLVLEFLDFEGDRGRNPAPGQEYIRILTVHRPRNQAQTPPAAIVTAREVPGLGPRFDLCGNPKPNRPLRYVNHMRGQVDELVLYPIADDAVTEADIQAFFDDTTPSPPPFDISRWLGSPPLSPGRTATLTPPLSLGRYAAVTWVTSIHDARPLAAHGQHRILTVA